MENNVITPKRGQKICPNCRTPSGVRLRICKCGHIFISAEVKSLDKKNSTVKTCVKRKKKKKRTKILVEDFTSLRRGDIIKVVQGHGPYWQLNSGEKEYLSHEGYHKVKGIGIDGVHTVGAKVNNGGHCYIYMGSDKIGKSGTIMRAHKLLLIKKHEDQNDCKI